MESDKKEERPQAVKPKSSETETSASGGSRVLEAFLHNQRALRSFISKYLVPTSDIDDISQEAFLRAYRVEQQRQIDHPKAFLFRIAKNLVLSEFSRKSRKLTDYIEDFEYSEVLCESESLEDNVMAQQKLGIFCEAVATLTPQCRRAFLLKRVYGMPHKEIAANMGLTVSTVEKHLSRGLKHCRAVINERYEDCSLNSTVQLRKRIKDSGGSEV